MRYPEKFKGIRDQMESVGTEIERIDNAIRGTNVPCERAEQADIPGDVDAIFQWVSQMAAKLNNAATELRCFLAEDEAGKGDRTHASATA